MVCNIISSHNSPCSSFIYSSLQYNGKQFTNPLLSQAHVNRSDIKSVRICNTTPLPYCTRVHSPGTDGGEIMRYRPNTYNYYFHYSSACFSHQCAIYSILYYVLSILSMKIAYKQSRILYTVIPILIQISIDLCSLLET